MAPKNRHWIVMADDTGDPGIRGTKHFGFAALIVERQQMARLVEITADFRARHKMYVEAKASATNALFRELMNELAAACERGELAAGSCMIIKSRYEGPYLRERGGKPADPHFLRNFLVRHTLETVFQFVEFAENDSTEVVLDRVDYSDTQIHNLRDYLSSELATEGAFDYPNPRWVTHADSNYVEGLQIAHHIAELAQRIANGRADATSVACARRFLRLKTLLRSREFTIDPRAEPALGRRARKQAAANEMGAGDHISGHPPP